jgi:hypothetical protein
MKHLAPITLKERREIRDDLNAEYSICIAQNNFFKGVCITGLATNVDTFTYLGFAGIAAEYIKKGIAFHDYTEVMRRPIVEQGNENR